MGDLKEWVALFVSANALIAFIEFLITRYDTKRNLIKQIEALKESFEEHKATLARTHILRFADDLKEGKYHSEEYFKQQILDIDTYNRYCETHPEFSNGLTIMASDYIRTEYKRLYLPED